MKVTIKRSQWLRGEGFLRSRLYRKEDGKMCCLGQVALAEGCSVDDIAEKMAPSDLGCKLSKLTQLNIIKSTNSKSYVDNHICMSMMETNDDEYISDSRREKELVSLGCKAGYELEFVD